MSCLRVCNVYCVLFLYGWSVCCLKDVDCHKHRYCHARKKSDPSDNKKCYIIYHIRKQHINIEQ